MQIVYGVRGGDWEKEIFNPLNGLCKIHNHSQNSHLHVLSASSKNTSLFASFRVSCVSK